MFKTKKFLSLCLAASMVLSTGALATEADTSFVPTEDGYYTADMVEAWNYYTPTQYSMCNGVFAGEADVTIDGDWATLHLYVCNPTPGQWGGLETGILSEAYITYDGVQYDGTLTSIGLNNDDAAVKLFTQDSSFFGITADAYNPCDTMEFVIPTAALSSDIEISAWVNLIMNSRQSFWLDINWLAGADSATTQSMEITATVAKNISTSSVTIPESTDMGVLSKTEDTVVSYAVAVNEGYGQTVTVSAPETVTLVDGDASLVIANDFDGEEGTLTASAEDVATIASYEADLKLEGSLSFTITVA